MGSWSLAKEEHGAPPLLQKCPSRTWTCLTLMSSVWKTSPATRASGGRSLTAPSRGGLTPNDSKLQMEEGCSRRTARQRRISYQTQPAGATTATETATPAWACTVTTGTVPPTDTSTRGVYLWSLEIDRGHQQHIMLLCSFFSGKTQGQGKRVWLHFFSSFDVDILGELDKTRLGNYVNKEEIILNKEQKYNVKDIAMKVRDKPWNKNKQLAIITDVIIYNVYNCRHL